MVDRRKFLLAAAGGTATVAGLAAGLRGTAAAEPTAAASAPAARAVPRTLAHRRAGGRTLVPEAAFPLTHLGVRWSGGAHGGPGLRLRTRSGWGPWRTLHGCGGGHDHRTGTAGVVLPVPGAVGYELRAAAGSAVVELNTVDGPGGSVAAPPAAEMSLPGRRLPCGYLSRAAWGADESLRFRADGTEVYPPAYYPVQSLTVHHTAGINDDPDPAGTMRAIYYMQAVTYDWGDFGYHLAIDEAGRVYEGRWSGADPVPVLGPDPGPDGRPQMSNAAHVLGYNAGNVGVVLLGDFTNRRPTRAARRSLTYVLAGLAAVCGLDPMGRVDYVNPVSGAARNVDVIPGHRDWAATECPGNLFYPELPRVRRDVADLLR